MERTRGLRRGRLTLACGLMTLAFTANSSAQITARPIIQNLNPTSAVAGAPDLILTIDGSGFVSPAAAVALSPLPGDGSRVQWNGTLLNTTVVSSTRLTAVVPAGMLVGPATVTVTVINPGQLVSNASIFTVTAGGGKAPSLVITTSALLPNGTTGAVYAQQLTASGGNPPYTWSIMAGQLSPGVTLSSSSGVFSGTPTTSGTFNFTVRVTDFVGVTSFKIFSVAIGSPGSVPLAISTSSPLPDATVGRTYSLTLTASGGTPPYNWSIVDGFLPSGLRLDSSSGVTLGVPTIPGSFHFTVRVSDTAGNSSTNAFVVTVRATLPVLASATPSLLPQGTVEEGYSVTLTASGGEPPYRWVLSSGSLPADLTLGGSAGLIDGVPKTAGVYTFQAVVTDMAQSTAGSDLTLIINSSCTISAVVNGASFLAGPLAPGTMVSIFGSEIGPAAAIGLQLDSSGQVATILGGSRVLFDGIAAPLLFVQARQVNAVIPYEVNAETGSVVKIELQGKTCAPVGVPLTDSSPGLFTLDSSGKGQGLILNEDGALNSASNPALKGSVVVLYATGGGQTDPSVASGTVTTEPLPKLRLPVSLTVGGVLAETPYVGAAPNLSAGLLQLNVRIPDDAPTGDAVSLVLTIGSATSQPGVTVALH